MVKINFLNDGIVVTLFFQLKDTGFCGLQNMRGFQYVLRVKKISSVVNMLVKSFLTGTKCL